MTNVTNLEAKLTTRIVELKKKLTVTKRRFTMYDNHEDMQAIDELIFAIGELERLLI